MNDKVTRNLAVDLRPGSLEEFIGSANVINQVRSFLGSGRIPTAILLSGPTGCGKTTLARCITKALGGEAIEANAADDTGVDAARQLGEQAYHRALMGTYKVIILDEAHQLTKQAQNALLKHVEDAPPTTVWIFCTTEPSKLLPTLRGRCLSFTLGGLSTPEVRELVRRALNHLGKQYGDNTEAFVATLASNSIFAPRSILGAVERFVAGADPLGAIFGSQDTPVAFEIARATYKQDWETVRTLLAQATTEDAMTIRIVCVNYFKSALLKHASVRFNSDAILELTQSIPAIDVFGLAELSVRLYNICKIFDRRE
jgi:DNA polymerase-3 subunit gamma/tau